MNIEEIKKYILSSCNDCNGTFVETSITDKGEIKIDNCKCFQKLLNYSKYDRAGIGQDWWQFSLTDIEEDFPKTILKDAKEFIEKLKRCVVNKVHLFFFGKHGRGKTTIATLLLKEIVNAGYKARIVKARHIIDMLYSGQIKDLFELDFLVIDEFDKINPVGNQLSDFALTVSDLMDEMGMILVSNKSIEELGYPTVIMERLESISKLEFKGKNYRRNFESKFEMIKKNLI